MKIRRIVLCHYNAPFRLSFQSAHGLRATADSVIVRLDFDHEISGYGEAAPRTYVTGESAFTVLDVIRNSFSGILFSLNINLIDDVSKALNKLEQGCFHKKTRHYNSALGAIDIALLDAVGKLEGIPLSRCLGPVLRDTLPYSISVPILPLQLTKGIFSNLRGLGFEAVKVLMGESEFENIERVRLIRSIFGDKMDIRVEANGKWTLEQAIANILKLKEFNITGVEEPLAREHMGSLTSLKKAVSIPIILDESVCSLSDAVKLVKSRACDIVNIKISKCGGLLKSRLIAEFAHSTNIPCQLGAHVGETAILGAAAKHFALTMPDVTYFEGYSFLLFRDAGEGRKAEKSKGENDRPGCGLDIGRFNMEEVGPCSRVMELIP